MVSVTEEGRNETGARRQDVDERKARPIVFWAILGVVFIVWQLYAFIGWIASGPEPTPLGPDPVPTWHTVAVWTATLIGVVAAPAAVYFWLIRPWRRTGRIQFDGLMLIGAAGLYWQDGGINWTANWYTYSAAFPGQLGSWYGHLPGWMAPSGSLFVEPFLWDAFMYIYAYFGAMVLGGWVLRKVKERRPQTTMAGLIVIAVSFGALFDLVLEPLVVVRAGLWTYPGAIEGLTIFHGHYYQFPLYEALLAGFWWGGFALFRYYRNDRGESIAERGVEQLRVGARAKTSIRLLAIIGAMNAIAMVTYTIPIQAFALNSDPWPQDHLDRSYLTDQLCGPGTSYACTGPKVPNPRPGSSHINPDGKLVTPDGQVVDQVPVR